MIQFPSAIETIKYTGAKTLHGAVNNTALSTQGGPDAPRARITDTAHGLLAGSKIYLQGFTGYDEGLYHIAVVATDYFEVNVKKFVAFTPAAAPPWGVWARFTQAWLFVGFKLHLNAADASGEDLTVSIDSDFGAAFDTNILTQNMIGITDIVYFPDTPILIDPSDVLKFAWTNTGAKTWGIDLHIVRRA